MNLGILKSFKYIFAFLLVILISSCSIKDNVFFNKTEKIEKVSTKEEKSVDKVEKIIESKEIKKEEKVSKEIKKEKTSIKSQSEIKNDEIKKVIQIRKKAVKEEKIPSVKVETAKTTVKEKKIIVDKPIIKNVIVKKTVVNIKKKKPTENTSEKSEKAQIQKSSKLGKENLDEYQFDFIKKGIQDDNTFLIVGGIQGDEPGGFMAASLLSTHYDITKGSVWIVPNLNFYSIIKRSRGPFGDMNRKFAALSKNDPEYNIIQRIKKYISAPEVKLILNLHDGSGFYRPMYIDKNHQPRKWGQCIVIDQEVLPGVDKYSDTYIMSEEVISHLNKNILKEEDIFRTKNTHTRFNKTSEEQDMAKTLTYFAVKNGKSAFAHETSKSLTIPVRVYYKLLAMEKFMDMMGIEYKRKFKMNVSDIKRVLNDDISIKFDDTDVKMPLKDIRNIQKYFPINKDGVIKYLPSNPLIKIVKIKNVYTIYYGNRRLTKLEADYAEYLNFDTKVDFIVDGKNKEVKFGDTITIKKDFLIKSMSEFRVNVIGYRNSKGLETNVKIKKSQFLQKHSIEKKGNIYRIEFYKKKKFAGMILAKYI